MRFRAFCTSFVVALRVKVISQLIRAGSIPVMLITLQDAKS